MAEEAEEGAKPGHPCHWTHEHAGHTWWPAVPDPGVERVLHIGLAQVWCPGI